MRRMCRMLSRYIRRREMLTDDGLRSDNVLCRGTDRRVIRSERFTGYPINPAS